MITAIIIVGALLAFVLGFLLTLPRDIHVSVSRDMATGVDTAFQHIKDFRSWPDWSPWLIHEPDTSLTFSKHCMLEGGSYTWDGKFVGAGTLKHVKFTDTSDTHKRIEQQLSFVRPFKSQASNHWQFATTEAGATRITWSMQSKMPWFMSWMVPRINQMVRNDYRLGLLLLEQRLVSSAETFAVSLQGDQNRDTTHGIGESYAGSFANIGTAMEQGYTRLYEQLTTQNLPITGLPLAAYHKTNLKQGTTECDMVIPVDDQQNPQSNAIDIPGGKGFLLEYNGHYEHMEVVWHLAMSHVFMTKRRYDKKRPALEIYVTNPAEVAPADAITQVWIPLK